MEYKILIVFLLLMGLCTFLPANPGFWDDRPIDEMVETILGEMDDEELLAQVFMLGYVGTSPSAEIRKWIRRGVGGVKIFSRNVAGLEAIARDVNEMQALSLDTRLKVPLLIATDQEGGWVRHIKGDTSTSPGNIAIGASGLPRDALLTGYYIGREMRALGINMNFAPTIDIYSNPAASVIGPRSFSSDSVSTSILALAYLKGMSRSGVIGTAKHYPGHGNADKDSHGTLPVIHISSEQMWERELLPYRVLIREGLPAIMSAHLAYPEILGDMTPASRSPYFLKTILREQLNFNGVLITDDMEMNGAISGVRDTARASLEALTAGNDMILISHTPRVQNLTWRSLYRHLQAEPSFRARITEAVRRILTLKLNTFRGRDPFPVFQEAEAVKAAMATAQASTFFGEQARRSVTLIKGADIPYKPEAGERILLIGQFESFLDAGMERYPQADRFYYPFSPFYYARADNLARIPRAAKAYDTLIFCLSNFNSLEILQALHGLEKRIIVISTLTPVYLRDTPWIENCLAVYGTNPASFKAGFAVLNGDYPPEGELPVDFLDRGDPSSRLQHQPDRTP